jgi:anti-anti-sigma factor
MLFRKPRPVGKAPEVSFCIRETEATAVVCCTGSICLAQASALLAENTRSFLNSGKDVVLDLSEVEMIDTEGIGQLVTLHLLARAAERDICIIAPAGRVLRSLELANVASLFRIHATRDAALTSCSRGSALIA